MNRILLFAAIFAVSFQGFAFGKKKPKNEDVIVIQEASDVVYVQKSAVVVVAPPATVVYQAPAAVVVSGPRSLTLTNESGYTAYAVYATPAGGCCSSTELLGASGGTYLQNGESREIVLSGNTCVYNIRVDWSDPSVSSTNIYNADLCRLPRWTLVPPPQNCCR